MPWFPRLRRLLQDERGVALVIAVAVLGVLSIAGTAMISYSSANARSAEHSADGEVAFALAEAGVAHSLSILNNAPNALIPTLLFPSTTVTMAGGTTTFSGTLAGTIWTIRATGTVANPTGAAPITRSVTSQAEVVGIVPGATAPQWNRLFHNHTGRCLTIQNVDIPSPVTSRGDICLKGTARITGSATTVNVGDDVTLQSGTSIGLAGARIAQANIADKCKYGTQPTHRPCTAADRVYANVITTSPQNLTKPDLDLAYWYQNAAPGPRQNCTTGSFPNGFDNDGIYNNSRPGGETLDSQGVRYAEVTPTTRSYTCEVRDASGSLVGEISWNHVTHVMKIHGTIFVDGDIRFDDDGQLVNYQGRAIIYSAGDLEFDEVVCAGGNGTSNCIQTGMSSWDPEQNMMIILSGDDSEYDQGQTSPRQPAGFQGVMYAEDDCTVWQAFHSSGPVVCDEIKLPFNEAWPTFYPWPPLQSLIEGQMYGNPLTAPDQAVVVLGQWG